MICCCLWWWFGCGCSSWGIFSRPLFKKSQNTETADVERFLKDRFAWSNEIGEEFLSLSWLLKSYILEFNVSVEYVHTQAAIAYYYSLEVNDRLMFTLILFWKGKRGYVLFFHNLSANWRLTLKNTIIHLTLLLAKLWLSECTHLLYLSGCRFLGVDDYVRCNGTLNFSKITV